MLSFDWANGKTLGIHTCSSLMMIACWSHIKIIGPWMFAWYGRKQSYYTVHTAAKKCDRQKLTVTLKVFFIKAFFTALVWHSSSARQAGKNGSFLELTLASGKHTMWSVRRQYGTCAQSKESETFFLPLFKGTKTMNSFKSNVTHCDDTMLSDKP